MIPALALLPYLTLGTLLSAKPSLLPHLFMLLVWTHAFLVFFPIGIQFIAELKSFAQIVPDLVSSFRLALLPFISPII